MARSRYELVMAEIKDCAPNRVVFPISILVGSVHIKRCWSGYVLRRDEQHRIDPTSAAQHTRAKISISRCALERSSVWIELPFGVYSSVTFVFFPPHGTPS